MASVAGSAWSVLLPLFLLGWAGKLTASVARDSTRLEADDPRRAGSDRNTRKRSLQLLALAVLLTPLVLPDAPRWLWLAVEAGPLALLLANVFTLSGARKRFVASNLLAALVLVLGWGIALAFAPDSLQTDAPKIEGSLPLP